MTSQTTQLSMDQSKPSPWQKTGSRVVYDSGWMQVIEDAVVTPTGSQSTYSIFKLRNGVFIFAIDEHQRVHVIRGYRYPLQAWVWEVPGGGIDDGCTPLQAAQQELREELGLQAADWQEIGQIHGSVSGHTDDRQFVFVAKDLQEVTGGKQAEEAIDAAADISFDELFAAVRDGAIADAQSVAAIMYLRLWLDRQQS